MSLRKAHELLIILILLFCVFDRTVISALKEVSPDRKCFRMVGGVLVERQVKDVLPALEHNHTQVSDLAISSSSSATILLQ